MEIPQQDSGLDPNRIVETRWLAYRWGYQTTRHLEKSLTRLGVKLVAIGNGTTLVRIHDIWDVFDA